MELVDEIVAHRVIDLVDHEEHRLAGRAELARELVVDRGQPGAAIDHEHQRIGLADRAQRLAMDARADHVARGFGIEPAGVDHPHDGAEIVALAIAPIAGQPRRAVDQRRAPADQAVEQRRLADIGSADDRHERHERCRHAPSPPAR
jgi:hypothetical protein